MTASAAHHGKPPEVDDEGRAFGLIALLRHELQPSPDRWTYVLRATVVVLITVSIMETFRIPEIGVAAYLVLFLSGRDAVSTVRIALLAGAAAIAAVLLTAGLYMFTLSEPAVRLPLIAAGAIGTMFLMRVGSALGPLFFISGFIIFYGQTLGDEIYGLALQPITAANTPEFELPEIALVPPEEALVHFVLWFTLVVLIPVALLTVANLLTGRDPALILRAGLAARLAEAARFCAGEKGAERQLEAFTNEGTAQLRKLYEVAGGLGRRRTRPTWSVSLIEDINRLCRLLLAWQRLGIPREALAPASAACQHVEWSLRLGIKPRVEPPPLLAEGNARALAVAIGETLRAINDALASKAQATRSEAGPHQLLAADAFSNPEYSRFAVKSALAVMICYFIENMTDWPGIHTVVITCFFVSLGSVGESLHKATLRITGCLIGGSLAILSILVLMPLMTDLGHLLLLLAPVTMLAAWIAYGSERIAYMGLQLSLAFYLGTLQGFGPTLDMETARDRMVGIVIGNLVILAVFTAIWPVRVESIVRNNLARALELLAGLLEMDAQPAGRASPAARSASEQFFEDAVASARAVLVKEVFEPPPGWRSGGPRPIDSAIVEQTGALIVPVSAILDLRFDRAEPEPPEDVQRMISSHDGAVAAWFRRAASWVRSGQGAGEVFSKLPEPPLIAGTSEALVARATWYALLHEDICEILDQVGPPKPPAPAPAAREMAHAAG